MTRGGLYARLTTPNELGEVLPHLFVRILQSEWYSWYKTVFGRKYHEAMNKKLREVRALILSVFNYRTSFLYGESRLKPIRLHLKGR